MGSEWRWGDADVARRLDEVSDTLDRLNDVLGEEEGLGQVLERLAYTALWAISEADAVSLTLHSGQDLTTAASTSDEVVTIDQCQHAAGEGPSLEAARTRQPVRVTVDDTHRRWPEFAAAAESVGVHAYLSAPLLLAAAGQYEEELVGALNVYGYTGTAFDPIDESLLRLLTSTATAAIGNARRYFRSRELSDQLRTALSSRAEIDQAKGALMAIHGTDADDAFARLSQQSQDRNVKLAQLAVDFLESLRQR